MASGSTQILGPRLKVVSADQSVSTYPLVIQFPNGAIANVSSTATVSFVLDAQDEGSFIGNFSTINCVGAGVTCTKSGNILTLTVSASGGGGGSGGGVWIATTAFQFNQSVSTIIFVGAFVDSAAYATNLATITISGTPFWNYSSTADARMGAIKQSTTDIQAFYAGYTSTADLRLNAIKQSTTDVQNSYAGYASTADARMNALRTSTSNIQAFYAGYTSTADARTNAIGISTTNLYAFNGTPIIGYNGGTSLGTMTVISAGTNITLSMSGTTMTIAAAAGGGGGGGGLWVSSAALQFNQPVSTIVFLGLFVDSVAYQNGVASVTISGTPFWNYAATADVRMNGFSTQNSTTDARLNAIAQSTTDIQASWTGYAATADVRMNGFSNQNSTTDVVIAALIGDTNSISADIVNLTYYLHSETTGTNSAFQLLLSSPSNLAEITKTQNVTLAGGLIKISSHVTRDIEPQVRKIPAGLWTSVTWASVGTLGGATQLVVSIATASYDLTTIQEIVSSTSPAITATSPERFDLVAVQTNDIAISTSDRILVQYSARTTLGLGTNVSIYYAGTSHPSHLDTPVGSVYKFVQLADTPQTLVGSQGKYLSVNQDQTTTVFVSSITDSFNAYTATADAKTNAIGISTTNLHSFDDTPIIGYNGGTSLGTMTVITAGTNITLSMSGTTMTITGAAGSGGGGDSFGSGRATQTVDMSSYNIVAVGTISVTGDVVSTNTIKAGTITVTGFLSAAEMNVASSFSAINANISSSTLSRVYITSNMIFSLTDLPPIQFSTGIPVILVSSGNTPFLLFNRAGHLSMGDPNTRDFPLLIYATVSYVDTVAREYNGALIYFVGDKRPTSGSTSNENFNGLKTVLDMQEIFGSVSTNGNYAVVQASFTNGTAANAGVNIQSGYAAGFDAQMTWSQTSSPVFGSAIGVNKSMKWGATSGSANTGVFGDKTNISLVASGLTLSNTYGNYMDIADNTTGAAPHNVYWLHLNSLTSTNGNTYGIYETVAGAKNYFAGGVGISTNSPIRALEVYNSSIASIGSTAGLYLTTTTNLNVNMPFLSISFCSTTIHGGIDLDSATIVSTLTVRGPIVSVGQFVLNGGTFTSAIVFPDGSIQKTAASAPGAGSADNMGTEISTRTIDGGGFGMIAVGTLSAVTAVNGQVWVSSYPYADFPIRCTALKGISFTTETAGDYNGLSIASVTSPATQISFDYFPFPNASTHSAYFQTQIPDGYDGSTVAFHVTWYASSGTAASNVLFALQGVAIDSGTSLLTAYGSSVTVITTYQVGNQVARSPTSGAITLGGNPTKKATCFFKLLRLGGDGRDTLTAFANVLSLDLRYRKRINSDEEHTP